MAVPGVKTLFSILADGAEGGKQFAQIVDLLLIHQARGTGQNFTAFDDSSGDFNGLDSYVSGFRRNRNIGYQYKFYKSSLSPAHRLDIKKSIDFIASQQDEFKLSKLYIVTPTDFSQSNKKTGGGDVAWWNQIQTSLSLPFELEHIGHKKLLEMFLRSPHLAVFYYPSLVANGSVKKRSLEATRSTYTKQLKLRFSNIEFVGMSVYKPEATRGVPMEEIYIPIRLTAGVGTQKTTRYDPIRLIQNGGKFVILGDPGSGKSTLLKFMSLIGSSVALQSKYEANPDTRLPIHVTLRQYSESLKNNPNISLLDHIVKNCRVDLSILDADEDFFRAFLETGQAIAMFDGLDELPDSNLKEIVRDRIAAFDSAFPNNTIVVSSRIVGYDNPFRFDDDKFKHFTVADLELPEIESFVRDWYRVRIEIESERDVNIKDLIEILKDPDHTAIRDLAENPLLLTIISLVHRIDAVLPDERVVLYQKCTETLLNTWHTWKIRDSRNASRGRLERRNRQRLEAIAFWMHLSGLGSSDSRAVVSFIELSSFLEDYIEKSESAAGDSINSADSAAEFLDFVRTKAGLLVEVGDAQYSFLHLTFQEYLTASHLKTSGESKGLESIWNSVEPHVSNARWHEVIRLLIGELKLESSQEYFIKKLINRLHQSPDFHSVLLLGGTLIDGILPAEQRSHEIVQSLLRFAGSATDDDQVSALVSMLQRLISKSPNNREVCNLAYSDTGHSRGNGHLGTALIARVLGLNVATNYHVTKTASSSPQENIFERLILRTADKKNFGASFRALSSTAISSSLASPEGNLAAASILPCLRSLDVLVAERMVFDALLCGYLQGISYGPLHDFTLNIADLYGPADPAFTSFVTRAWKRREVESGGSRREALLERSFVEMVDGSRRPLGLRVRTLFQKRSLEEEDGATSIDHGERVLRHPETVVELLPTGGRMRLLSRKSLAVTSERASQVKASGMRRYSMGSRSRLLNDIKIQSRAAGWIAAAASLEPKIQWGWALRSIISDSSDRFLSSPRAILDEVADLTPGGFKRLQVANVVLFDASLRLLGYDGYISERFSSSFRKMSSLKPDRLELAVIVHDIITESRAVKVGLTRSSFSRYLRTLAANY